jgi:hypothetical protein
MNKESELHLEESIPQLQTQRRNKWRIRVFEFIMISVAVALGFIAEEIRESRNERRLENEFARVLYYELLSDSVRAKEVLQLRLQRENDFAYLAAFFKDSSLSNLPKNVYPKFTTSLYMFNSFAFEPKDGILSQLRNSGSSQYFKSLTLQKLLGDINADVSNLRYRNEQDYQYFASPVKPFLLKHYDFTWLDTVLKKDPNAKVLEAINAYLASPGIVDARILNIDSFDRTEAVNIILFYKSLLRVANTRQLNSYINTNHKILQHLKEAYEIKEEK